MSSRSSLVFLEESLRRGSVVTIKILVCFCELRTFPPFLQCVTAMRGTSVVYGSIPCDFHEFNIFLKPWDQTVEAYSRTGLDTLSYILLICSRDLFMKHIFVVLC